MDLKELDNIAKHQQNALKRYLKIFEEHPDAIQVYLEDGEACNSKGEIWEY